MTLKDNHKFYAFIVLIMAIVGLVILASTFDRGLANDIVAQGKLRIIDSAIAGLIGITGMAAQALFGGKFSTSETIKAEVVNKTDNPVPTDIIPTPGELPENQKL